MKTTPLTTATLSLVVCAATFFLFVTERPASVSVRALAQSPQKQQRNRDPKCAFLREEYGRIKKQGQAFANSSQFHEGIKVGQLEATGATPDQFAEFVATSEEFAGKLTIQSMKINSCAKGQRLSSQENLATLDSVRQKHILRAKSEWKKLGGTEEDSQLKIISDRINSVYDNEAKSFYNSDSAHADLDPDIIKDYPDLLSLVQGSSLPPEQKQFFAQNSRYIKYEEAGRLHNILQGIDPNGSLSYAYGLRRTLSERAMQANAAAQNEAAKLSAQRAARMEGIMPWIWAILIFLVAASVAVLLFFNTERYAKYKAIRDQKLLMPYWFGTRNLVLWEPGEAVVLFRDKKLVAMVDATGGYTSISPWKGEEYKGRITYKSQLLDYETDPIHTSDGVPIRLQLGILWQIGNPNTYVQRIAADYHEGGDHEGKPRGRHETMDPRSEAYFDLKLKETAEKWIRVFAGSTLREHLCQLTSAKVISPYVQSYIDQYFQFGADQTLKFGNRTPTTLEDACVALNRKTNEYGIRIEKLEVKQLYLPDVLEQKLESVRLSFLQPAQATAETEAKTIERSGFNQSQIEAIQSLAAIIGRDNVARIEFMKAFGLAKIPFVAPYAPPLSVVQSVFPGPPPGQEIPIPDLPRQPDAAPEKIVGASPDASQEKDASDSKSKGASAGEP